MAERPYLSRPKVLYIGGTGRTGSTLLTRLLGEVPGWFPGGELASLWQYGLSRKGRCSCDRPIADCPVWSLVLADATEKGTIIDAERMVALRRKCWSVHMPFMIHSGVANRLMDRLGEFPETVESVYKSIATVTGSRVIVDSSKEPHYSWILRERTRLDIYFLHLVRDPRAVGYSWTRGRREPGFGGGQDMDRRRSLRAAAYFNVSNVAAEAIWARRSHRFRFMRYEDFVADPTAAVREIGSFVGEPIETSPVVDGRFVSTTQHIAWGNPNRFGVGDVAIRPDESWRTELGRLGSATMTAATAPVARRYGYSLRPSRTRGEVPIQRLRVAQMPKGSA